MNVVTENFYTTLCENFGDETNREEIISFLVSLGHIPKGIENYKKIDLCEALAVKLDEMEKSGYFNISSKFIWEEIGISKKELANLMLIFKEEREENGVLNAIISVKKYFIGNNSIFDAKTYNKLILFILNLLSGTYEVKNNIKYYGENFVSSIFKYFNIANYISDVEIKLDKRIKRKTLDFLKKKKINYTNICDKNNYVSLEKANITVGIFENVLGVVSPDIDGVKAVEDASKNFILPYYEDDKGLNLNIIKIANMFGKISTFSDKNVENKKSYISKLNKTIKNIPLKEIKCFDCQIGKDFNIKTGLYMKGKINGIETIKLTVVKKYSTYYVVSGTDIFYILSFCRDDLSLNCNVIDFSEAKNLSNIEYERINQEIIVSCEKLGLNINNEVIDFLTTFKEKDIGKRLKEFKYFYLKNSYPLDLRSGMPVVNYGKKINTIATRKFYSKIEKDITSSKRISDALLVAGNIKQITKRYIQASEISFTDDFYENHQKEIFYEIRGILKNKSSLRGDYIIVSAINSGIVTSHIVITDAVKMFTVRELLPEYYLEVYELVIIGDIENNEDLLNLIEKYR